MAGCHTYVFGGKEMLKGHLSCLWRLWACSGPGGRMPRGLSLRETVQFLKGRNCEFEPPEGFLPQPVCIPAFHPAKQGQTDGRDERKVREKTREKKTFAPLLVSLFFSLSKKTYSGLFRLGTIGSALVRTRLATYNSVGGGRNPARSTSRTYLDFFYFFSVPAV